MAPKNSKKTGTQHSSKDNFKSVAKALGRDDDKSRFEAKLGKLVKVKPALK